MTCRVNCARYDECLADAAMRQLPGFDCRGCTQYQEDGCRWGDGTPIHKLLLAIFYPEIHAEYRREERAHLVGEINDDGTWIHPQE